MCRRPVRAPPRGPSYFNRFRRKRGQRDLVETHDQEAADAVEQVDRAALPRRPRRSSQQNAALLHGYGYALAFGREEAVEGGS